MGKKATGLTKKPNASLSVQKKATKLKKPNASAKVLPKARMGGGSKRGC